MDFSKFINKLKNRVLWYNLGGMALTVLLLVIGTSLALNFYTHHGESIAVPDVKGKSMTEALQLLAEAGLEAEVTDTGYVKALPADYILEQTPAADEKVKSGHIIRLIINASNTPSLALPDIADNCSLREAMAKLKAMGFKVGTPQRVDGEKDWVYGVIVDGKKLQAGDRVMIDRTIILQVGDGMMELDDSISFVGSGFDNSNFAPSEDVDDFEEVL